jgi:selenocysteine-specific elongation factor
LPTRAFDPIVLGLERKGAVTADGERLRRAGRPSGPMLSPLDAELLARFETWALEPPRPKELAGALGRGEAEIKTALDRLLAGKLVVRLKPDLMMSAKVVAGVRDRLLAFLAAHGTIDAQQWKELTGASRKFTIPLAEYFDAEKLTLRVGDVRRRR